jgi:hypothetical protein
MRSETAPIRGSTACLKMSSIGNSARSIVPSAVIQDNPTVLFFFC